MGCIISIIKKKDKKEELLITNKYCFMCEKEFPCNISYNRHIPQCNTKFSSGT